MSDRVLVVTMVEKLHDEYKAWLEALGFENVTITGSGFYQLEHRK